MDQDGRGLEARVSKEGVMRALIKFSAVVLLPLGLSLGCYAQAPAKPTSPAESEAKVVVFAAASLKTALDAIGTEWNSATGKSVTFSYAGSSAIAKQIEQGAPADLFASADLKWMDYLAEKKLIKPETRVSLLGNKLVLIAPKDAKVDLKIEKGFPLSTVLGDARLATGDTKTVPVGIYAEAALRNLGVWDEVAPKIAGAENVRAALAFVARKEVPFGIVYGTDAKSEPLVKVVDVFPEETHPPIVYPFAVISTSVNPLATEFLAYLASPKAREAFVAAGFSILGN